MPQVHARAGGTRAPARCTRQRAVHPCGRQGGHRGLRRTRQDRARLFRRTAYESLLGRIRHGRKYAPAFLGDTRRGFPLRRPDFGRHPAVIPCRNDTYGTPGSLCPGTAVHFGQSVHHPRRGRPDTPEEVLPRQIDLRPPLAADRHEMHHACGQPFFDRLPPLEKGSQWIAITDRMRDFIFDYLAAHPDFIPAFRYSHAADELFFHTLLGDSPFAGHNANYSLVHADWSHPGAHPKTLSTSDLSQLSVLKSRGGEIPRFSPASSTTGWTSPATAKSCSGRELRLHGKGTMRNSC